MRKKSGRLVQIMGIDGSGKTTLAMNLIEEFRKEGIIFEYKWAKFESKLLKAVIKLKDILIVRETDLKENYRKSSTIKKKLFKNKLLSFLYEQFVIWDYILQIILRIKIPLTSGRNILCDRYVHDTVVDLAYDLDYSHKKAQEVLNFLFRFLPKPDVIIFVDVPEEIAFSRKDDVPSLEFLRRKRELYHAMLKFITTPVILVDGTKPIDTLTSEVVSAIKQRGVLDVR